LKHLKFIIIPLLSLILASCGSNLPAKSSLEAGKGVFAIPKSMVSEVNWPDGWKTDLQITDSNGKVLDDMIRLHPLNGSHLLFVKNLSPGQYNVSGYRRVSAGETAIGSPKPIVSTKGYGKGTSFTIVEGEVTVLPLVFNISHVANGYNRSSSVLRIRPLVGESLDKFKALMAKANKNNEWKVNWPK